MWKEMWQEGIERAAGSKGEKGPSLFTVAIEEFRRDENPGLALRK